MKKSLIILCLCMTTYLSFAQVILTTEGTTTNNTTTGDWTGINIPRSVPTVFTFRNNAVTSVNVSGYMLQAGDEVVNSTNNNLQGEVISGNKFVWNGTDMTSITHGIFTGYNINAILEYNYCYKVPMALVRKSNGMTNTGGGVAYNIVNMTNAVGAVVKGMNGVNIYNNTFYSKEIFYTGPGSGTWRGIVDIYTNSDITPNAPSTGTKVKNNIFYTKNKIYNISLEDAACIPGFESDYNIFYCEAGSPIFNYAGALKTFEQWQALGYDTHSKVINPNFIDFTNFVPAVRLDYGTDLGTAWQYGLSTNATWTVGVSPETAQQNGTWQVGARIYAGQAGTTCTPPSNQATAMTFPAISSSSMTAGWTRGSGDAVMVIARQGAAVNFTPVDGSSYPANAAFGSGTQLGDGNYVVYNGSGASVTITALTPATSYYFAVIEYTSGTFCYKSAALSGSSATLSGYCSAGATDINNAYISNVTIGTVNTTSGRGAGGYEDYTTQSTTMQIGVSYTAKVTVTNPLTSDQILIWADWNNDGDFTEAGENIYSSTGTFASPHTTASFTPPAGAFIGKVRMRIRLHDLSNGPDATPCGNSAYGEVEDYSVNVTPACAAPAAPVIGTITQPTCSVSTGSVSLTGLPSSGSWTLIRTPGGTSVTGTGTSYTLKSLPAGTYTLTVTNSAGCVSPPSGSILIKAQPATPSAPKTGTVTQPSCSVATGSVALSGLPATGTWTLTRSPGGTMTGTGTTMTVTGLPAGTSYSFKVTSESGCTSSSSSRITINTRPTAPGAPVIGTVTQPTTTVATGSVALRGLPSSGNWILTRLPDGTTVSGRGTTKTVTGLPAGKTYSFTVTNSSGCVSAASANVVINAQPLNMTARSLSDDDPASVQAMPDENLPRQILVYPNPFTGSISIAYNDESYTNVNIINSSGVIIRKEKTVIPVQVLDLSDAGPGLYILEFVKGDKSVVRVKVLKH